MFSTEPAPSLLMKPGEYDVFQPDVQPFHCEFKLQESSYSLQGFYILLEKCYKVVLSLFSK